MKISTFKYNEYNFEIKIGEKYYRYLNEGIYQEIYLSVNDYIIYGDTYGYSNSLKRLLNSNPYTFFNIEMFFNDKNKKEFKCLINNFDYICINNEKYDEFINWLIESLTPINIKRKNKINKLKNVL